MTPLDRIARLRHGLRTVFIANDLLMSIDRELAGIEESLRPHLGTSIRQRRRELEWTQAELATKAGVSIAHISRMEAGQRTPSPEVRHRLVKALGPLEELE